MDFGVLDGLVSSENKKNMISGCDLDLKTKWFRSATHEDEWRDLKMAKTGEQQRCNGGQNMLSFSSPNTHSVTFSYYARNNTGFGAGGPFTPSQWMELEHQALIYKYIDANAAIPSNLLIPIKKALQTAAFSAYSAGNFRQNAYGWAGLHLGFCNSSDPEPGRCRRTDGKKWRCAKDAVVDQKYCERHMNRGRHRSRKPVEAQNGHSHSTNTAVGAAKLTTGSTAFRHTTTPNPPPSSQDNREANMETTMLFSSPVPLIKNQNPTQEEPSGITEFGLVCSDSLLNPMQKSDPKSQSSLHQFMEDWPHSSRAPLSATSERLDLSPLRMGMGKQANQVPGGPLGEVLQHSTNTSPTGLNLMTPLGYLL